MKLWAIIAGCILVAAWVVAVIVATAGTRCVHACAREPRCVLACKGVR